ncbi:MAG: polysaccharide biosynthesis/export family protein [Cognatishimia sp.]|uniref:polysaccharide biosynthesis/export family protein n=1 Tax=Cognatishimia sp. TaxID=2211648 RepID=UPI00405A2F79
MITHSSRLAKCVAVVAALAIVASCGLPRSGPNKREIYSGSVQKEGDSFVVAVNDRVTRATAVDLALGFSDKFKNAGVLGSDVISPGDTLSLTIWENVDQPLLGPEGQVAAVLETVQVDGSGHIFVPYAGRIRAAGNTPEAVRRIIRTKLEDQTPNPQVEVRRAAGNGSTVSIAGAVAGQGVYPIERPTRTLSAMLANAGGITVLPEVAQVTVTRGKETGKIWFQDLYDNPRLDIALRAGDRILVEADTRAFTALGATGTQTRMTFDNQAISAIEAIAQVGGLSTTAADPKGVFVFRNEPQNIANAVLGRDDLIGAQRMVYVLDLTKPNGMFHARDFVIRDDDTLYVTEAPFTQWDKTISALTGSASSVSGLTTLGSGG